MKKNRYSRRYRRRQEHLHECPTCHEKTLTDYEKRRGYQCAKCTRRDEYATSGPF